MSRPRPTGQVAGPLGQTQTRSTSGIGVFSAGAMIGVLGGLIGLGGAEFRLPLLIGVFGFAALQAVILNKAMSLVGRRHRTPSSSGRRPLR